jgi:hypothetical protein
MMKTGGSPPTTTPKGRKKSPITAPYRVGGRGKKISGKNCYLIEYSPSLSRTSKEIVLSTCS